MYLGARRLGISDRWFWAATPKELALEVEARKEVLQARKARLWILAALIRAKRLPDFKRFVGVEEKAQTWQEMKARTKELAGESNPRRGRRAQGSQSRAEETS